MDQKCRIRVGALAVSSLVRFVRSIFYGSCDTVSELGSPIVWNSRVKGPFFV